VEKLRYFGSFFVVFQRIAGFSEALHVGGCIQFFQDGESVFIAKHSVDIATFFYEIVLLHCVAFCAGLYQPI